MYLQASSSRTPSTRAPKKGRVRLGAVKPAITTSCCCAVFTFSQSAVRRPDAYGLSARLAMMPSRCLSSASAKNFVPPPLRWLLNAISLWRGRRVLSRFLRSRSGSAHSRYSSADIVSPQVRQGDIDACTYNRQQAKGQRGARTIKAGAMKAQLQHSFAAAPVRNVQTSRFRTWLGHRCGLRSLRRCRIALLLKRRGVAARMRDARTDVAEQAFGLEIADL